MTVDDVAAPEVEARRPRLPWKRARWERGRHLAVLAGDGPVEVACSARRTSARGWDPWIEGVLHLPARGPGRAEFRADDPHVVDMVTRRGATPMVVERPVEVSVRPVRYRAETFHGEGSEIVVARGARRTLELAIAVDETETAAERLAALDPDG